MKEQTDKLTQRLKVTILVLSILVGACVIGLAVRCLYIHYESSSQATMTVQDNLIGGPKQGSMLVTLPRYQAPGGQALQQLKEQTAAGQADEEKILELTKSNPQDNSPFEVKNMLPGDCVTQYFQVKAHHTGSITLYFKADVTEQTKQLSDVLRIRVSRVEDGTVLCDDTFAAVAGQEFSQVLSAGDQKESTARYQIDVYLDTSVGNEYQASMLKDEFMWYVKEDGSSSTPSSQPSSSESPSSGASSGSTPPPPSSSSDASGGMIDPPNTGEGGSVWLWCIIAAVSLGVILFVSYKRRKDDACNE